jgi:hypothetical protein
MMFFFTPLEGIMLHHQGRNIFRPMGCILPLHLILTEHYLKAPSDGEERKESPPQLSGGGVCRVVTGVFGREQLLLSLVHWCRLCKKKM